mgnify:CR=1 FL=1
MLSARRPNSFPVLLIHSFTHSLVQSFFNLNQSFFHFSPSQCSVPGAQSPLPFSSFTRLPIFLFNLHQSFFHFSPSQCSVPGAQSPLTFSSFTRLPIFLFNLHQSFSFSTNLITIVLSAHSPFQITNSPFTHSPTQSPSIFISISNHLRTH